MGRKADELRDELELVEAERRALAHQNAELLAENDRLKNDAAGVTTSAPGWRITQAVIPRGPMKEFARFPAGAEEKEGQYPTPPEYPGPTALEPTGAGQADLQAIQELHRPPPPPDQLGKVESSLDVVRANNAERASLQTSARLNNALISRIASAMRVTTWDEDGSQILEKCQRWDNFAYWIKGRQKLASGAVANELGTVLAALVAPADLANWIMSRPESVPECVVETAGSPVGRQPDDHLGAVTRDHLLWIRNTCDFDQGPHYAAAFEWLTEALKTERGTKDLLSLLNLVLLPSLRRMFMATAMKGA